MAVVWQRAIIVALIGVMIATSAPVPGVSASSHAQIKEYVGSAWIAPLCHDVWQEGVGGACFERPPGSTRASGRIDDAVHELTAGYVVFRNADGPLESRFFCKAFIELPIPPGTTHVNVNVQDAALGLVVGCGVTGATTGLVTAIFT